MKLPGRAWSISEQNPRTTATETALCTTPFLPESFQAHLCCGFKISHVVSSTVDMVQTGRKTSLTGGGQTAPSARAGGALGSSAILGLHSVPWLGEAQEKSYTACRLLCFSPTWKCYELPFFLPFRSMRQ